MGIVGMGVMVHPRDLMCVLLCTFYGSVLILIGLPFVPKTRYMYMFSRFCPFTWLFQINTHHSYASGASKLQNYNVLFDLI